MVSASGGGSSGKEFVRNFHFDLCASEDVGQAEFFQLSGVTHLLDSTLDGYLATVFAYGQTGSGKTYRYVHRTSYIVHYPVIRIFVASHNTRLI